MNARAAQALQFFQNKGWSKVQAAGIVGNLMQESGLNPSVKPGDKGTAHGVAQWRFDRWTNAQAHARKLGKDAYDFEAQLDFVDHELRNRETDAFNALTAATTVDGATAAMIGYERPQGWSAGNPRNGHGWTNRLAHANRAAGMEGAPITEASVPAYHTDNASYLPQDAALGTNPYTLAEGREQRRASEAAAAANVSTWSEFASDVPDILVDSWSATSAVKNYSSYQPQPGYAVTEDMLKKSQERVSPDNLSMLGDAVSPAHYQWLEGRAVEQQDFEGRMARHGWTGTAARVAFEIFDPVAIGATIATEGLLGPLMVANKVGRIGRTLATGALAGTANAAGEVAYQAVKPGDFDPYAVAQAAAMGMVLGGAVGSLRRNPATQVEADRMEATGRALAANAPPAVYTPPIGPGGNAGAREVSAIDSLSSDDLQVNAEDAIGSLMSRFRYSTAARLGGSKNSFVRAIYDHIGLDAGGKTDNSVVNIAATENQSREFKKLLVRRAKVYQPAVEKWVNDRAVKDFKGDTKEATRAFNEDVTSYIRSDKSKIDADVHPSVKAVADHWRQEARDLGRLMQNPLADEGGAARSIKGFETFTEDMNYIPRLRNDRAITNIVSELGDKTLHKFLKAAIMRGAPTITEEVALKAARGWLKRVRNAGAGVDDGAGKAPLGGGLDDLQSALDDLGLSPDEMTQIEGAMHRLTNDATKGSGPARGKRRTLFDEGFEADVELRDGGTRRMRIDELFINDFQQLSEHYYRQASGWVALGKIQVANPSQPGKMLIDGITSQADIDKLIKAVRQTGADNGLSRKAIDKDVLNLEFQLDAIQGKQYQWGSEAWKKAYEWTRDLNFMRVMNQSGFAAMSEIPNIASTIGVRAMLSNMPSLRTFKRNATTLKRTDEYAEEVEAMTGHGGDDLLAMLDFRSDQYGDALGDLGTPNKTVGRIDDVMEKGKNFTAQASLLRPVTNMSQLWAAKSFGSKMAKLSIADDITSAMPKLRMLGIADEGRAKAIFAEMRKHSTSAEGDIAKVYKLNTDKWAAQPRADFEKALYREVRRVIQENDPGMMGRYMSIPTVRMIMQFRSHMLGSWDAQFVHNIQAFRRGDQATASGYFMTSLLSASVFHMARVGLAGSLMAEDQREGYYERMLSPASIGKAAFARAGFSSFVPGTMDTMAQYTGLDPIFGFRTTSLSDSITGSATLDLVNNAGAFTKGVGTSLMDGRAMSQPEVKSGIATLPFQNWFPFVWLQSHLVQDLEKYTPRPE